MASENHKLVVIAGPSGVGKGTLVKELVKRYPQLRISVSMTTRHPRPGEQDGVDYFFVSDTDFDRVIAEDGFLEWATVHGTHRYGTPRRWVEEQLVSHHVVLEIDRAGALQVKASMPEAYMIFIAPPSWDELVSRLSGRGSETLAEQQVRLHTAHMEIASQDEFDVTVINDDLDTAVREVALLIGLE